ncbi:MAG: OprO/OprP family phosphate-selective porin [Burkholderiaceae bacterium]|nr:OprO/OprP family phosphate-selective porin [Burkholderiaceae bacterium]
MKRLTLATSVLAALMALPHAQAAFVDDGKLSISGFGTLGVAKSDTDKAQFVRYNQAEGVADGWRLGLDSNLGLQATYQLTDQLSATAQVLTRQNTSPTFTTDLTWAFVKYRASDEISVRVGRVQLPIFLISDYQNVGYANTMMRPPTELYAQVPLESIDGADVNWQHAWGDTNFTVQAVLGTASGKLFLPATASVATYRAPAMGISMTAEHGPLTLRYAHLRTTLHSDDIGPINSLTSTLAAVGFKQLAADFGLTGAGKKLKFDAIGMTLDWNNLVLQGEYGARRAIDPVYVPQTDAWYLMGAYRIGKFVPYYAHASIKDKGSKITLPAGFPASGPLSAGVRGLMQAAEQDSNLIGVRWNFANSAALKFQVDRVKPKTKTGTLIYGPAAGLKESVTVIGASIDYVF